MADGTIFPAFIKATYRDDAGGFPAFEKAAQASAGKAEMVFSTAFKNITQLGERALVDAGGKLTLDTAGLKAGADAAALKAAALRQIATAAETAARETGDTTEATRLYVQAARAAALEAEQGAAALRSEAAAAEALQAQLARLPSLHSAAGVAADAMGRAQLASAKGAAQNKQALFQAGQQVQDFAVQVAAGGSPITAFAQQIGQLGFVLQGATGSLAGVARFLSGPWGLALTLGASAVAFLATRMGDAEKATKGLGDAQRTGVAAADALAEATATLDKITGRGADTAEQARVRAVLLADARLKEAEGARVAAMAELDLAKARLAARQIGNEGRGNVSAGLGQIEAQSGVNGLEARLRALDGTISEARKAISSGTTVGNFAARFLERGGYERRLEARTEPEKPKRDRSNREQEKAAREAERATKELEQALKQVRAAFDPAEAAAERYRETIAEIGKLEKAKKLSPGEAATLTVAAGARRIDEEAKAWESQVRATMERLGVQWSDSLNKPLTDGIDDAGERLKRQFGDAGDEAGRRLKASVLSSAEAFNTIFGGKAGALLQAAASFRGTTSNRLIRDLGDQIFGKETAKAIGEAVKGAILGAELGQTAGSLILGGRGSRAGEALGGAIGGALGKPGGPLAKGLEKVFKPLGEFAGPLGAIAGGLLGGALGSLFKSTPKASATIGGAGGKLTVSSITGTSGSLRQAAGSSADSAITTLERLAEQLGATIDSSRGSVSIGTRKGKYRVDPSGRGITKTGKGAIDFGEDAEAAVRAATLDLIRDGVLAGLRSSTQRLLQGAKDLDTAASKALRFEQVFADLKQLDDPVGAAIDGLNKEFKGLISIFGEAGASAAELADLERLYGTKRTAAIKEASEQITATLRELVSELKTGDNGLSLRDRLSNALAKYDPLRSQAQSGTLKDFDGFAEAARTVLDIERQLGGSTASYFDRFAEVIALSEKALKDQEAKIATASAAASPFGSQPAGVANDNVVGALGSLGTGLGGKLDAQIARLDAVNANLGRLIAQGAGGGGGGSVSGVARLNF